MNPFIELRHSVRQYLSKPIEAYKREVLDQLVTELNKDSGLHMQICYDEPDCFHSALAHYGKFTNVNNYIAIVGPMVQKRTGCCTISANRCQSAEVLLLFQQRFTFCTH